MPTCPLSFLSTPSAGRATGKSFHFRCRSQYFYPRPPRGGRQSLAALTDVKDQFLSTPSAGRATRQLHDELQYIVISIHALRGEGDEYRHLQVCYSLKFLSTPSAGRATAAARSSLRGDQISIHALRGEGDSKNGEKHLRFCFIIKRSAQIWKSLSKNIRKKSRDLHRTA